VLRDGQRLHPAGGPVRRRAHGERAHHGRRRVARPGPRDPGALRDAAATPSARRRRRHRAAGQRLARGRPRRPVLERHHPPAPDPAPGDRPVAGRTGARGPPVAPLALRL
ncbi:MAG: hypothetical protein AVDCRST_MAG66-884, partial [uncultured Pseudonocardia sp.]